MDDWRAILNDLMTMHRVRDGILAALILFAGWGMVRLVERRLPRTRLSAQHQFVFHRVLKYVVFFLSAAFALRVLGVDLGVLLGAAGILTVALGFAAQTSASNLISGLFLMVERPFVVGDTIRVGETTGRVVSIGLLSVRLCTPDNLSVRIPSETVLKANVANLTYFPIRRLDLPIGIAYKENIAHVREVLLAIADQDPLCLEDPKPQVLILGYGASTVDLQFSIWCVTANFLDLRNSMYETIKAVFDAQGIELPCPHRVLYTGAATEPFPVRLVSAKDEACGANAAATDSSTEDRA